MGTTASGTGAPLGWSPVGPSSLSVSLLSSTMQTKNTEALATIFSRTSAPPAPLISRRLGSTASAPSTYTAGDGASSSPTTRMPAARSAAAVASELGTAAATSPGRAASCSMNSAAVLPVPTPIVEPGGTYASAASATARFCSSRVID